MFMGVKKIKMDVECTARESEAATPTPAACFMALNTFCISINMQIKRAQISRAFYSKIFCALAAFDVMHVISVLTSKSCFVPSLPPSPPRYILMQLLNFSPLINICIRLLCAARKHTLF
jgi:hypothetical protein